MRSVLGPPKWRTATPSSVRTAVVPTAAHVLELVAAEFRIRADVIRGAARTANVCEARHVAVFIMRTTCNMALVEIGSELGGRDHSTIIHSAKTALNLQVSDPRFRLRVRAIQDRLLKRFSEMQRENELRETATAHLGNAMHVAKFWREELEKAQSGQDAAPSSRQMLRVLETVENRVERAIEEIKAGNP